MKKKLLLLLVGFIAFYSLIHLSRHIGDLAHGRFDWGGEKTFALSVIRNGADMVISFLFALIPYLILYRLYPQKKWVKAIFLMIISLTGCFLLSFWWTSFMEQATVRLSAYSQSAVFFYTADIVFGMAFYFIRYAQYKELQQKEALLQTRQSELSFLRSQINPHFLFNNLNNIYSLVYYKSEQALTAIAGLSELLRYMLYDMSEQVPLSKEAAYIEKYIALQQLRFEKPTEINMKLSGNLDGVNIPPLIFIPFVENAFKHGDSSSSQWLGISLSVDQYYIHFSCSNKKGVKHKDAEGGIGIDNVKRRLLLLYPEKHKLDIKEDNNMFTVKLELYYGK